MKLFKKSLIITMVLLLSLSSAAFGARPDLPQAEPKERPVIEVTEDPEKEVRVIVELTDAPAINKAIQKGIRFEELSDAEQKSLENDLLKKQTSVQQEIMKITRDVQLHNQFTTVVNGFSADVKAKDVEKISKVKGVKEVHIANEYERPEIKPEMKFSKELIEAQQVWNDYGFEGEGMVIGVIDSGIDYTHKDMVLNEGTEQKLTEDAVNTKVSEQSLKGAFFTEKIPYGYNYMDNTTEVIDVGPGASEHGMHVAGTVGANGDEENGGLKGVAPEAQLLALKVFGNDPAMPSTFSDIIIKAIDDSIKMDADVLNLSLGATAGFVSADDPEQEAVARAVDNGIMVSISAGNSSHLGDGFYNDEGEFMPSFASNPDYGVSGSPGVSYDSMQVASIENMYIESDALTYEIDGVSDQAVFMSASSEHPNDYVKNEFGLENAGLGMIEDFIGKDFTGKYALIQRGAIAFVEKTLNAQFAGAEGVIIYNNADGVLNMATDPEIQIPQLGFLKADGEKLAAAISDGKTVTVSFNGETSQIMNPEAGKMSAFTSWGLTPNLDFKPEITAPGGNILSTLNNDDYGIMSGTSMAAPHVAGGSALVFQRVDEEFDAANEERVNLAKNMMMNTSKIVIDEYDVPVSPRRQGAGLMQLHAALSTPVVVTEKETDEAKVALKEISESVFDFSLVATNYSDEDVEYDVNVNLQTDYTDGEIVYPNGWGGDPIQGAEILVNGSEETTITVPAGESVEVIVEADLTDAFVSNGDPEELFVNGYYVEGFVSFTDPTDTEVPLNVPFAGFKGDWTQAPVIDAPIYEEGSFYGYTSLLSDEFGFLGADPFVDALVVDPEKVAFSPNGDGNIDNIMPLISFLRNAKEFKVNVLDQDEKVLRTLYNAKNQRKNYFDSGATDPFTLNPAITWDGKVNNKLVAEGQYYIELLAKVDYEGAEWQSVKLPINVDVTAPTLTAEFNEKTQSISYAANDAESGMQYLDVLVDGTSVTTEYLSPESDTFNFTKKVTEEQLVEVVATDFAGNEEVVAVQEGESTAVPTLDVFTPEPLEVTNESVVAVEGYAGGQSPIKSIEIDGKAVEFEVDEEGAYFYTEITFEEDGVHDIQIKATAENGKSLEIARKVIVDTTSPVVEVLSDVPNIVGVSEDNPLVDVKVSDNFDEIRLRVNGNEVYANAFEEPFEMRNLETTVEDVELQLEEGLNTIVLEVTDLAGNTGEEVLSIYKNKEGESAGEIEVSYSKEDISQLIAESDSDTVYLEIPSNNDNQLNASVSIDAEAIQELVELELGLWIGSGDKGVYIPASVLAENLNGDVVFNITEMSAFASNTKGLTLLSNVMDFKVTADGEEVVLTDSPLTFMLPVDESKVKDERKVTATSLNKETGKWAYAGGSASEGVYEFTAQAFSTVAVVEGNKTFNDISKHWAKDEVEVLASLLITDGRTGTTFVPDGQLTRAEFAVLLSRTLQLPTKEVEGTFSDLSTSHWSTQGVEAAARANIVNGMPGGKFEPNAPITREQMATMIMRAITYVDPELVASLDVSDYEDVFKDEGKISAYAKESIFQAVELEILNGMPDGSFAPKKNSTRAESAVVLYRYLENF